MSRNEMSDKNLPSKADIDQFVMLYPMLDAVLSEIRELSKKKQDGVLNNLKVKKINKLLEKIKSVLANEPMVEFLDLLDEEALPTNSDAVLMIVHFKSAMEQFRDKYFSFDGNAWDFDTIKTWKTRD